MAQALTFRVGEPIGEMVERLGGSIHFEPADEWFAEDGSIYVHGETEFDIVLPSFTSPLRDRFTTAHELGHYFLHSRQGEKPIIAFRSGSNRIEWEANWFAAELLMPCHEFLAEMQQGKSIADLAVKFYVSEDAARVRNESLKAVAG